MSKAHSEQLPPLKNTRMQTGTVLPAPVPDWTQAGTGTGHLGSSDLNSSGWDPDAGDFLHLDKYLNFGTALKRVRCTITT